MILFPNETESDIDERKRWGFQRTPLSPPTGTTEDRLTASEILSRYVGDGVKTIDYGSDCVALGRLQCQQILNGAHESYKLLFSSREVIPKLTQERDELLMDMRALLNSVKRVDGVFISMVARLSIKYK